MIYKYEIYVIYIITPFHSYVICLPISHSSIDPSTIVDLLYYMQLECNSGV
jgi:hypothetical protein